MMIHSFLLIGQSNAAGRGLLNEAEPLNTCGNKLKVLRNGRWQIMYRPVNPDRSVSGVCLAESFAEKYSKAHPDVEVGIIPCADGGTSLEQWQPGGILLENAINCAKLAMRTSYLNGILWHQGESDCGEDQYPLYYERLSRIIHFLRKELDAPDIPFLLGGLGDFLAECTLSDKFVNYYCVNNALQKIAREEKNCAFVSAVGLGANPDNLHFNAKALKEFGFRYFDEYQKYAPTVHCDNNHKENDSVRTEIELL